MDKTKVAVVIDQPGKLDLNSYSISEDKIRELLRLFPEIRTEGGKIDFNRLKLALGEAVDAGKERYGMNWPGKAECFKTLQQPSMATLRPCPEESINFNSTENLIIEGDNLEVLKLLQKSYLGKVKMIYIDPPYNTGNDFIYPDNYTESLQTYLEYTGQVDAEGKKFSTNTDTDGRFHSKWLNMMYPRLYLARNLLREDGIIFISIDDHEVDNLHILMKDIFGEENALVPLIWSLPRGINAGYISRSHEYILAFARNREFLDHFRHIGEQEYSIERCNKKIDARHPASEITFPAGIRYEGMDKVLTGEISGSERILIKDKLIFRNGHLLKSATIEAGWTMKQMILDWLAGKSVVDTKGQKIVEFFFKENGRLYSKKVIDVQSIKSILRDVPDTQAGRKEIENFFGSEDYFDYPKPSGLIQKLVELTTEHDEIVIDFFAGSGPAAQAVMSANTHGQSSRHFILIQLPEPLDHNSLAAQDGLKNIADICKERVRRVIKKLNDADTGKLDLDGAQKQDRGFRVFKLAESNFKPWNAQGASDAKTLEKQLELHINHIRDDRNADDILYEILLKSGFSLTTPVEKLTLANKQVYQVHNVEGGVLLICLERALTLELIRTMADKKPQRVVCLDEGFAGNDQLKANAVQIFKTKDVTSFKTV